MDNIIKRLGNLITVKSIVTIILTLVFAILCFRGDITAEMFMQVWTMVVAFFFGSQKLDDTKDTGSK